jgi:hypothetical protein
MLFKAIYPEIHNNCGVLAHLSPWQHGMLVQLVPTEAHLVLRAINEKNNY